MKLDEDLLRRADMARTGATAHEMNRLRNGYSGYVYLANKRLEAGEDASAMERLARLYADDLEHFIATGQKRR